MLARRLAAASGLAGLALLTSGARAATPLALSCLGCHQPRVDARSMPALNRLGGARIAAALRAARDAPLPGSIMARFAAGLSDADIEMLAHELGNTATGTP